MDASLRDVAVFTRLPLCERILAGDGSHQPQSVSGKSEVSKPRRRWAAYHRARLSELVTNVAGAIDRFVKVNWTRSEVRTSAGPWNTS